MTKLHIIWIFGKKCALMTLLTLLLIYLISHLHFRVNGAMKSKSCWKKKSRAQQIPIHFYRNSTITSDLFIKELVTQGCTNISTYKSTSLVQLKSWTQIMLPFRRRSILYKLILLIPLCWVSFIVISEFRTIEPIPVVENKLKLVTEEARQGEKIGPKAK